MFKKGNRTGATFLGAFPLLWCTEDFLKQIESLCKSLILLSVSYLDSDVVRAYKKSMNLWGTLS